MSLQSPEPGPPDREDDATGADNMERYQPKHPLPMELRSMARQETVCKFCGVSYLIHHEIKVLEEKLAKMEKELVVYRGAVAREEGLKAQLEGMQIELDAMKLRETTRESRLSDSEETRKQLRIQLDDLLSEHSCTKREAERARQDLANERARRQQVTEVLLAASRTIRQVRSDLGRTKLELADRTVSLRTQLADSVLSVKSQCLQVVGQASCRADAERSRVAKLLKDVRVLEERLEQRTRDQDTSEGRLDELRGQVRLIQEDKSALEAELLGVQSQLEEEKTRCRTLVMECDQQREQNTRGMKEHETTSQLYRQKEVHLEETVSKLKGELLQQKYDLESLQRTKNELQRRCDEYMLKEEEEARRNSSSADFLNELKTSLEKSQQEASALKVEKEKLIRSHQSRVEQLKVSYRQKMEEASHWPEKMEKLMREEREKHVQDMALLEQKLKENFVLEMEIEKQKHQEMLDKYKKNQSQQDTGRMKAELSATEERHRLALAAVTSQMAGVKKDQEDERARHQSEMKQLKAKIGELEAKLQSSSMSDPGDLIAARRDLVEARTWGAQWEQEVERLKRELETIKQETIVLQEIVRKECEERLELTEALSQAKEELLTLKRPPQGYIAVAQSNGLASARRNSIPRQMESPSPPHHVSALPPTPPGPNSQQSSSRQSNKAAARLEKRGSAASTSSTLSAASRSSQANSLMATKRRLAAIMASNK